MSDGYPSDWESLRKEVYQRDNYTCQNCGSLGGSRGNAELHAHHVVPKAKGGHHHLRNLKTLCKSCHNAVHGGESVNNHIQNQPQDIEAILQFPELVEIMEYHAGMAPAQEIGICMTEQSTGLINSILDLIYKRESEPGLSNFIESTLPTDNLKWEKSDDDMDYTWISLESSDYSELLLSTHSLVRGIINSIQKYDILAILFPFDTFESDSSILYWIYSQPRSSFYPFAPLSVTNHERDHELEIKVETLAQGKIRIDQEEEYWYPIWSERDGTYPWN